MSALTYDLAASGRNRRQAGRAVRHILASTPSASQMAAATPFGIRVELRNFGGRIGAQALSCAKLVIDRMIDD